MIQIPRPVADLAATQIARQVRLSWTLPQLNTDGSSATTLARFEIYRLRRPAGPGASVQAEDFAEGAVKWQVLDSVNFDAYREGEKLVLTDRLEGLDDSQIFHHDFCYAIKTVNRKKQEAGFSNIATARLWPVSQAVGRIKVGFAEGYTELQWEHPSRNLDGSAMVEPSHYHVYRSELPGARVRQKLTPAPIDESKFLDTTIVLGKTYYYIVRPVTHTPSGWVEGPESGEEEVTNVDVYPPKAPQEPTAISNGQAVSLVWVPNTEPDIAGYLVFRSSEEGSYQRLTPDLITTASYLDKSVEAGKIYTYRIRAVDLKGNESEFSVETREKVE
ncbi:MAG: hypothetical protein AB1898_05030 [Acidobacteriota bacterium]